MTTQEIRDEAIEAAKQVRDGKIKWLSTLYPSCNAEEMFQSSKRSECILARYVLSLTDPTPVDRDAFAESLACVSYILDNRWQLSTAGQLRMLKGLATSIPPARTGGSE